MVYITAKCKQKKKKKKKEPSRPAFFLLIFFACGLVCGFGKLGRVLVLGGPGTGGFGVFAVLRFAFC